MRRFRHLARGLAARLVLAVVVALALSLPQGAGAETRASPWAGVHAHIETAHDADHHGDEPCCARAPQASAACALACLQATCWAGTILPRAPGEPCAPPGVAVRWPLLAAARPLAEPEVNEPPPRAFPNF